MGIQIVLEDANGKAMGSIEDPTNIIHRLFPSPDNHDYRCLGYVDWYGDTVFNRGQMKDLRRDLEKLLCPGITSEEKALIAGIDALSRQCEANVHCFLKFYGD
jgi:hypothetical protein